MLEVKTFSEIGTAKLYTDCIQFWLLGLSTPFSNKSNTIHTLNIVLKNCLFVFTDLTIEYLVY